MPPVIYDVAVSIDGFISGPSGDVSQFAHTGPVVDDYTARMAGYSAALMGRHTYEFGYQFGLHPGANPYPHLETYVFSTKIALPETADVTVVSENCVDAIKALKARVSKPIYLCGGGAFASYLLSAGLVNQLIMKRAPILLGTGVRLFEAPTPPVSLTFKGGQTYDGGYALQHYYVSLT